MIGSARKAVAVACLIAIALAQVVFGTFGVRCTDSSGRSQIELLCARSDDGGCHAAAGDHRDADGADGTWSDHDGQDVPSGPCEDELLGRQAAGAKVLSQGPVVDLPVPVLLSVLWMPEWEPAHTLVWRRVHAEVDRPPDELVRIRTTVLLV